MARVFNDPGSFVEEMIEGFVSAAGRWVESVPGGVVRSVDDSSDTVVVVTGGGSGHFPAFGGLVGPGLAHGAVMGNVFASPSTAQVEDVVSACERGRGALLVYGNYAGDVLNFTAAQERLRECGIDVRTVRVTDDIASAGTDRRQSRRGIAGDLAVIKVAGAAAASGRDLNEVERLARLANDRTVSLGVAFGGCTLPGADGPLFTIPDGRMAIGMGIHGEPGLEEIDVPSAEDLAELLVGRLLADVPELAIEGASVVPLVNGLGAIKIEELYVLYRSVLRHLERHGLTVVEPEVGELCTSFDMEGCSLTLLFPDDELRTLWAAPADSVGYRKSGERRGAAGEAWPNRPIAGSRTGPVTSAVPASDVSRAAGQDALRMLTRAATVIDAAADELGRLDAVAGDGDHGIGMRRGVLAARDAAFAAVDREMGAGSVLRHAADAWGDRAGGTSGALWARMLHAAAAEIGDTASVTGSVAARAVTAAGAALRAVGGAEPGDKTMVDAVIPFVDAFTANVASGKDAAAAWRDASAQASHAAAETAHLSARRGRARTHGDRSVGTPDPGAVSFALICESVDLVPVTAEETR